MSSLYRRPDDTRAGRSTLGTLAGLFLVAVAILAVVARRPHRAHATGTGTGGGRETSLAGHADSTSTSATVAAAAAAAADTAVDSAYAAAASATALGRHELRVCADPNNLPFSNARGEGFENRLAELVARELHATVRYTWWAQRRGFIRNTLNAAQCDLVIGVPSSFELAWPTRPYYRSTYVFVTRKDRHLAIRSFDDSVLKRPGLRIGVQLIGDDYANTPPAHALARRGLGDHLVGFTVYGDYGRPNPPARIVEAVAKGEIDVAVVWGPLAGYFAERQGTRLVLTPVQPQIDPPFLPFVFDIAMAVRRRDSTFRTAVERVLVARRATVDSILAAYRIPRLDVARPAAAPALADSTATAQPAAPAGSLPVDSAAAPAAPDTLAPPPASAPGTVISLVSPAPCLRRTACAPS